MATLNVKDYGAHGNGTDLDTAHINAAFAAAVAGDDVYAPAGTYLIDAEVSVGLKSGVRFLGAGIGTTTLKAKPNAATNYGVVDGIGVDGITVAEMTIKGECHEHTGSTGEWGHCLNLLGCAGVTLSNVRLEDAWGDGIYIGANGGVGCSDIMGSGILCTGNGRQGMSIIALIGGLFQDSVFEGTYRVLPGCGVDVEPNENTTCRDITFINCQGNDNLGEGFFVYKSEGTYVTDHIYFVNCTAHGNSEYGFTIDGQDVTLTDCEAWENTKNGLNLRGERVSVIGGSYHDNTALPGLVVRNGGWAGSAVDFILDTSIDGEAVQVLIPSTVIGHTEVGGNYDSGWNDYVGLDRFPITVERNIYELWLWCSNSSSTPFYIRAVIYDDDGADQEPYTLKTPTPITTPALITANQPEGLVRLPLTVPMRATVGEWWLGFIADENAAGLRVYWSSTGGHRRWDADDYSDGPASPAGTMEGVEERVMTIFAYAREEAPPVLTLEPHGLDLQVGWS